MKLLGLNMSLIVLPVYSRGLLFPYGPRSFRGRSIISHYLFEVIRPVSRSSSPISPLQGGVFFNPIDIVIKRRRLVLRLAICNFPILRAF